MLAPVRNDRLLAVLALVAGIVLIVVAVVYWAEPANSLPASSPVTRPAPTTTT